MGIKPLKHLILPLGPPMMALPSSQPKHQIVKAVHIEVAKDFEDITPNLLHKALQSTSFWTCTTNLMIKLLPLLTDCMPSVNQDLLCHTITKQGLCVAEYEYVGNPHIDLMDEPSLVLKNNSLCSLVLAYHQKHKKTFLPLDQDPSTGQVIIMYPQKYQEEANGWAHHLVKYMEYENGLPALHWFNHASIAAAQEMD